MSKVIAYKNDERVSVCQIRFDSGEKVLVSFANNPAPSFKVMKLLFGIIPIQTVWEFDMPVDCESSLVALLAGADKESAAHPLDAAISRLLSCRSCAEAIMTLKEVELQVVK